MKTKLILFIILFSVNTFAQVNWSTSYTGQTDLLDEIAPLDNGVIWTKNQGDLDFTISNDGGKTWGLKQFPSDWNTNSVGGLSAVSENVAYVILSGSSDVSAAGLYKTIDKGTTWVREETIFNAASSFPNMVHFWNENEGFAMGDGFEIYYYNNGVWTNSNLPTTTAFYSLNSSSYLRIVGNTAYFTTNKSIFKSIDKGVNWTEIALPIIANLNTSNVTFDFKNDSEGVLIYNDVENTLVYVTSDGGGNWSINATTMFNNLSSYANKTVRYLPELQKYIYVGRNGLFYSDAGVNWIKNPYFEEKEVLGDVDYSSTGIYLGAFKGEIYYYSNHLIIPDANFEQALIDLGWDTNGLNGNILLTEAVSIDSLKLQDPTNNEILPNVIAKIKSLKGIEAMTNLVSLEAGNNELTSVDLSKNVNLSNLFLNDNQLSTIDVSKNVALVSFGIMRNQFTDIDVSILVNLVNLFVHDNQLTSLDVTSNKELNWLYTSNNQLSTINLSKNTKLRRIDIYGNLLTSIDVSMLVDLEDLRVGYNQITYLDISKNSKLFAFSSNDNNLEALNVKNGNNSNFTYFSANNNANLTCIQVDNVSFSTTNWELIDASSSFNTNCEISPTVNIPDYNMKTALVADVSINTNGDTEIQVSEAEAITGTITLEALNIVNLTGIESFKNITGLNVSENNLTTVDLSNNTKLSYLSIYTNQLTALDITSLISLESLYAGSNQITEINVTNNLILKKLWLNTNNLSALDISKNTYLEELELDWNYNLSAIDFTNNLKLYRIHLWKTAISTIDVSQLVDLQRLYVSETNLKTIDISNNIKLYDFRSTDNPEIPTYDFSNNTALNRIDLSNSDVSDVDISNNINLTQLLLGQNKLRTVDISKNTLLQEVYLNNNKLENIDISKNTSATKIFLNDNLLERAYLKNGNNTAIVEFDITNNANLSCIAVDDVTFSAINWTSIDESVNFNTTCSAEWELYTEDENFENALTLVAGLDNDGDEVITYEEAQSFTGDLDLSGQNITSIIGLEAFTNAASINISENNITDISSLLNGETVITLSRTTGKKRTVKKASNDIKILNVSGNLLETVDISKITSITELYVSNNKLTTLNINNGSNATLVKFDATGNNNLTCIQVDNVTAAAAKTDWIKETTTSYSTNCSSALGLDNYLKESISIYPNPAITNIQVSIPNDLELKKVEIYNFIGKRIINSKTNSININHLSKGVYFVKVSTDKGFITDKLIKE